MFLLFLNNVHVLCVFSQRSELELNDCLSARKIQKADREKLRRDRLNEHFVELGNVVGNNDNLTTSNCCYMLLLNYHLVTNNDM